MTRESEVEKKVCAYAKERGWLAWKFVCVSIAGVPDRIFMQGGHVFFIEFKRPRRKGDSGGKVSRLQEYLIEKIESQGGIPVYRGVDDIKWGKEIIYQHTLQLKP